MIAELDQLPQRLAGTIDANTDFPFVRRRRHGIFTGFETPALIVEHLSFLLRCAQPVLDLDATCRQAQARLLLCRLQGRARWIVSGQRNNPVCQLRQHGVARNLELPQASEMVVPSLDQALAFALDIAVGLRTPVTGPAGVLLLFVEHLPPVRVQRLGLRQFGAALPQQHDLLAARCDQCAHSRLGSVECAWRQHHEQRRFQRGKLRLRRENLWRMAACSAGLHRRYEQKNAVPR